MAVTKFLAALEVLPLDAVVGDPGAVATALTGPSVAAVPAGILDYLRDPELLLNSLLNDFGGWMIALVALMVFIESGVLFPVLPGDSMIFTLGILHTRIPVPLWVTIPVLVLAAIAGNIVGYWFGHVFGERLFKPDARFLKTEHLDKAAAFFDKYGGRSLVLARFIPFVRTFVPVAAGMARYPRTPFITWNIVGALIWVLGFTFAGIGLGDIPIVKNNVEIIALVIVFVSVLPIFFEVGAKMMRSRRAKREEAAARPRHPEQPAQ